MCSIPSFTLPAYPVVPEREARPCSLHGSPSSDHGVERVALSEIVSALSFALDLTEGADPGHALRSCLLGLRVGVALGLKDDILSDLYYALLLKDVGCSSNSARVSEILGGDDRTAKRALKTVNWTDSAFESALWAAGHVLPQAGPWRRLRRLLYIKRFGEVNNAAMFRARCNRGASIARKIGVSERCARGIYSLDEHWNGGGYPEHLAGSDIPLLSRILAIAQHLDVFSGSCGRQQAIETLKRRSGTWFDPELARIAELLNRNGGLWEGCGGGEERARVIELEPGTARIIGTQQIDRICEAFAEVVDAKSPMTYQHSIGVMRAANAISDHLQLEPERRGMIHRAALLHDLGKLRVPNSILDKQGSLNDAEWAIIKEHPALSGQILSRVRAFAPIAVIAGRHHERLDGSGYPHGLREAELSLEDCIVAAADVYGTLAEERPYRAALKPQEIEAIFERLQKNRKLHPACCDAVRATASARPLNKRPQG